MIQRFILSSALPLAIAGLLLHNCCGQTQEKAFPDAAGSKFVQANEKKLQLEHPAERQRLPEFQVIPAANPSELTPASQIPIARFSTWTRSQGDEGSRRYSCLAQINRGNVSELRQAWIFYSGDGKRNIEATPIIVNGVLYGPTAGRAVVALDAATGKEIWRFKPEQPATFGIEDEPARRGLVYWAGAEGHAPRILVGNGNWIYALDAALGQPIAGFGDHGRTPLPTGATVGGAIYKNVYVTARICARARRFGRRNSHGPVTLRL